MTKAKPLVAPGARGTAKIAGGSGIAAAVALAVAIIAPWEGKSNDPYRDIVGVQTVCFGETRVAMRRYSDVECAAMLERAVSVDFAPAVFKCAPGLRDRPTQAAASISLAYNIGTGAFCKSTAARRFNAGDWRGGCQAIARFVMAGGKPVRGLINRRAAEVKMCMEGL
jgi:lysozyme